MAQHSLTSFAAALTPLVVWTDQGQLLLLPAPPQLTQPRKVFLHEHSTYVHTLVYSNIGVRIVLYT